MAAALRQRLASDVADARLAFAEGDLGRAWGPLEDAHVLSQPWAGPHVRVHIAMFARAWRTRDRTELAGQLLRALTAGPASLLGRSPEGNPGRASVPATRPMPMSAELRALLDLADG
jgi:hypothetical protein